MSEEYAKGGPVPDGFGMWLDGCTPRYIGSDRCPTCRETVGVICQTCGKDYAAEAR